MKLGADGQTAAREDGPLAAAREPRREPVWTAVAEGSTPALEIEEIPYAELLRYEPHYDLERLPVRFESDEDADWEYEHCRFYAAYAAGQAAGFTGMALTRRTPGTGPTSVYHRSSLTLPAYRGRGVWTALWNHKLAQMRRLGWVAPETALWVLTRDCDSRYAHRGFELETSVVHRYKGERERFFVWCASWADVLRNAANRLSLDRNVLVHP